MKAALGKVRAFAKETQFDALEVTDALEDLRSEFFEFYCETQGHLDYAAGKVFHVGAVVAVEKGPEHKSSPTE